MLACVAAALDRKAAIWSCSTPPAHVVADYFVICSGRDAQVRRSPTE
jgi:hypothetical protein